MAVIMDMNTSRRLRRSLAAAAMLGLATALTAACADDASSPSGEATGQQDAGTSLEILTPGDGDAVSVPFEVQVDTNVELGEIDDERHHLHVWFGDDQSDFELATSTTAQVEEAPGGETTLWVQVHTFEHQPASDPVSVTVTVDNGGGGGEQDDDSGGGGYDY